MSSINKRKLNKKSLLFQQDKKLFHTKDLEILWQTNNKSTLHNTISRYIKKGILIPIYRGFYSTSPLDEINPLVLGAAALHDYAYLSTESVLFQHGIINQSPQAHTFCSTKTKHFTINNHHYRSRQLQDKHLFHFQGIIDHKTYKIATPERAAADLIYYNPNYHLDGKNLLDQNKLETIKKKVYSL